MQLIFSLLVMATLCIVGIWIWGRWQVAKLRNDSAEANVSTVMRTTRNEPLMFLSANEISAGNKDQTPNISFASSLDPDSELIATLTLNHAIDESFIKKIAASRAILGRRFIRYCLLDTTPSQMQIGLTLADRSGAVCENELNQFLRLVDECADAWSADVEVESIQAAITRACIVDAQCAALDTQIYLHLACTEQCPSQEQLLQALRTAGLQVETTALTHCLNDATGNELARVFTRSDRPEAFASFVVDVPRVPQQAFERTLQVAQQLAKALNATVVDDNGKPLSDTALSLVRARLTDVSRKLAQAGMAPGSERAYRLFS